VWRQYDNWGLSTPSPVPRASRWKLHVVTGISCVRLIGGPVFVVLFASPFPAERAASVPSMLLFFLTDVVDGYLARRWSVTTNFGYVLDGVADRSTHIAVIVALVERDALSSVLAFIIIFREVLLYAARSLFTAWWTSNRGFRLRVRITAVAFKVTVGVVALLTYLDDVGAHLLSPQSSQIVFTSAHAATWIFALWSYWLLAQQVHQYASIDASHSQSSS
jgi:CDP-diacylglycerol--glycerol-3-phosphate 3-phosphatidyltransferase